MVFHVHFLKVVIFSYMNKLKMLIIWFYADRVLVMDVEEFVCGEPKVDIRVGDEYQAEIPPMIRESERAAYLLNPLASSDAIVVGLPVEITWIDTKLKDDDYVDMSESLKSLKTKRNRRVESGKQKMHLHAVPERSSSSWEDLDVDAFVLGLYTFGKNFTQVKKLLESKETGELLSFYYGKFYKSTKHKIWSNSLKKRSRKCIQGKKLYSGWRLHQLLSRLVPSIADESLKTKLVNVSLFFALNIILECVCVLNKRFPLNRSPSHLLKGIHLWRNSSAP